MSGGVDSAVAAARMVDAGHEVTGVHLALSKNPQTYRSGARGCCSLEDSHDARRAADVLGIPFYVWDFSDRFAADVVDDFVAEYAAGRTPNPCLRCNEKIKFAAVLDRGIALGFDAIATGHYAVLRTSGGRTQLWRSAEQAKDQSYVLGVLNQAQLSRCLFPLGHDTAKADVRAEAAARGLYLAKKPDSHDICFIPSGDTAGFLERHAGQRRGRVRRPGWGQGRLAHGQPPVHRRPAPRPAPGRAGSRRPAPLRAGHRTDHQHRHGRPARVARSRPDRRYPAQLGRDRGVGPLARGGAGAGARRAAAGPDRGPRRLEVTVLLDDATHGIAPGQAVVCYDGDRVVGSATIAATAQLMTGVTGVGSLPGTDYRAAVRMVLDALGGAERGLPYLPELPARGPWAAMIGRACGLLVDLPVSLDAGVWRLSDTAGDRPAAGPGTTLRDDLDMLRGAGARARPADSKLQVAGPWTLAASLFRALGRTGAGRPGARRDLAQSLARGHVAT